MDKIEEFLESVEETLFAATPDLPRIQERVNQLWLDVTRGYATGIAMPQQLIDRLPGLGDFELPPPPPPPPPPASWYDRSAEWVERHPWKAGGVVAGVVGASLLVGYGGVYMRTLKVRRLKVLASERKQVVVVLGGDTPLGAPLVVDLERKGYIVIASVATPQAADDLERHSRGYVRALVLDPTEPLSIPIFLRSLAQTLTRRFPINSPGDPFESSPAPIHAVLSLLSLASPHTHAPLEHISLQADYLPYLNATQLTPLHIIQSMLPLLRNISAHDNKPKTIVVCLPASLGHPFASLQSMAAAGTLRALEVLRREILVAALTGKSDAMRNIRVVVADVGSFDTGSTHGMAPEDVYKSMEHWSVSEKLTYGAAFASLARQPRAPPASWWTYFHVPRKPTDISVFLDAMASVVSNGQFGATFLGLNLGWVRNLVRGERFAVGAGASWWPSLLLNMPRYLLEARNATLPVAPFVLPKEVPALEEATPRPEERDAEEESGSEADVESNAGDGEGEGRSSWVRLNRSETQRTA